MNVLIIKEIADGILKANQQNGSKPSTNAVLPKIALVGTECVGKTSLFNSITGTEKGIISSTPSDFEQIIQEQWADAIRIFDGPSYKGKFDQVFVDYINSIDLFIQVCDIETIRRNDRRLVDILSSELGKSVLIVLNKCEKAITSEKRNLLVEHAEKSLGKNVICVSAQTGENIALLLSEACSLLPNPTKIEVIEAFAREGASIKRENVDVDRRKLCDKIIKIAINKSASIGASTKTEDLTSLLFLHAEMINSIAEVFNIQNHPDLVEGKVPFILRSSLQTLAKFVPIIGPTIGVATAILWTQSVGNIAIEYFEQQITSQQIPAMAQYFAGKLDTTKRG